MEGPAVSDHPSADRRSCGRKSSLEQLSFATAPALYAALWLSAGIILDDTVTGSLPEYLSPPLCCLPSSPRWLPGRPSASPSCPWPAPGFCWAHCSARSSPLPTHRAQLGLIADAGGATTIDGEVTRTTPIRLTQSSSPFGNTTREEQSESLDLRITSADGRAVAGGLRATLYGPGRSSIPVDPLRGPNPRPDRDASARALSRSRRVGCYRVAAPARHRRGGFTESLRHYIHPWARKRQLCLLAAFRAAGRQPAADRFRRFLRGIAPTAMAAAQPRRCGHAERHDPWRPHLPGSPGPRGL